MPNTFSLIASSTVGSGGTPNITFSSIPSTYTDLCLLLSVRSSRAGVIEDGLGIQINSSTTGYTYRIVIGQGSNGIVNLNTTYEQTWAGAQPAATATASTFGNAQIYIPNYAGSAAKSYSTDSAGETNAGQNPGNTMGAILQSSTAAVSSLLIKVQNGNLVEFSTAYLYGIVNS
jgi:hypothetical protein